MEMLLKFALIFLVFQPFCLAFDDSSELAALRGEMEALKQGQQELQKSLRVVRDILSGKQPPLEDVFVTIGGSPSKGDENAEVIIVEFTDFQCPFCGAYARETFGRIVREYIKSGKVRYVSRNFPLQQSHPLAEKAAEAALCAAEQGKYWEAHERFFRDQQKLATGDMPLHAAAIGADVSAFMKCIESGKYGDRVARDVADGQDLSVRGTPTFFVGYADSSNPSRIQAVRSLPGNVPFREFQRAIEETLKRREETKP